MNVSKNPLVSGIIIFLNEEQFIEEAIESVFAQTYDNWELLLVDDGSTDRSTAIARRYAQNFPEKVRYLEHENHQNRGMAASRNLGIRRAKGEYIAFLDGDDIWLPRKLKDQVRILESQPEAAMVYGRTLFWYSWTDEREGFFKGRQDHFTELGIEPNRLVKPPELLKLFLEDISTIASCCSVLIRREVFERVGGYEEAFRSDYSDMPFYTKLYLQESVLVVDGCWDKYRQHPDSSTKVSCQNDRDSASWGIFLNWVGQYLSDRGVKDPEVWQSLQKALFANRHPNLHRQIERVRHPRRTMKNILKKIGQALPAPLYQWLRTQWRIYKHIPPLGRVNWGDLRSLKPISQEFGCDRGQPVDRYYINNFLACHAGDIKGRVLEIGDPSYTRIFGGDRVTQSDVLHGVGGNPEATIVGDLADAPQIPSDSFDCFILTQTLQYLYDVPSALKTVFRILKPGGVALVTLPSLTPIHNPGSSDNDGSWSRSCWYWGFTPASTQRLFEELFPPECVTIDTQGNVVAAIAFLEGLCTQELKKEELDYYDPSYPILITVRAVKPDRWVN